MPVASGVTIPFTADAKGRIVLDTANLVSTGGTLDRMKSTLGAGGGELLIIDQ